MAPITVNSGLPGAAPVLSQNRHGPAAQTGQTDRMDSIAQLGPLAVVIGTCVEGETILLAAGAAVSLGLVDFWMVIAAACAGSLLGDQAFFWLGRLHGSSFLAGHPKYARRVRTVQTLLLRHRLPLLGGYRFVYGMRGIIPFAFGLSPLCWKYFLLSNLITATIWSLAATWLGMHAGQMLLDKGLAASLPLFGAVVALLIAAAILTHRFLTGRQK